MAEAEYWRFTVARDCQKKNTSENRQNGVWSRRLAVVALRRRRSSLQAGLGGGGVVRVHYYAPSGSDMSALRVTPLEGRAFGCRVTQACRRQAACILSEFPMYFSFGSPAQQ